MLSPCNSEGDKIQFFLNFQKHRFWTQPQSLTSCHCFLFIEQEIKFNVAVFVLL